mmetsp:Transcript_65872/g.196037  ORF Transcript_65872/g.196037 Transcript_65872/m.196037 type:complete len:315 (+) Transcript_65872:321-1265(+)
MCTKLALAGSMHIPRGSCDVQDRCRTHTHADVRANARMPPRSSRQLLLRGGCSRGEPILQGEEPLQLLQVPGEGLGRIGDAEVEVEPEEEHHLFGHLQAEAVPAQLGSPEERQGNPDAQAADDHQHVQPGLQNGLVGSLMGRSPCHRAELVAVTPYLHDGMEESEKHAEGEHRREPRGGGEENCHLEVVVADLLRQALVFVLDGLLQREAAEDGRRGTSPQGYLGGATFHGSLRPRQTDLQYVPADLIEREEEQQLRAQIVEVPPPKGQVQEPPLVIDQLEERRLDRQAAHMPLVAEVLLHPREDLCKPAVEVL